MTEVIAETIKYMWRSEKNRLFMIISTALMLLYTFFVLPNVSGENEINIENLETEMTGNVVQFEGALDQGLIVPGALTGTTAYIEMRREYVAQREVLTALKQGDAKRYIAIPYRPDSQREDQTEGVQQVISSIFAYDLEQPFQSLKNEVYIDEVADLSFHTVHERTSLQQLHLFLIGLGPVILLIGLVFLISDVHVKDRSLKTQKMGVPMSWPKYSFIQSLTALGFVLTFYVILFGAFTLLNGILHGFGSFDLPIGYYNPSLNTFAAISSSFDVQRIGWFMLRALPFLFLLAYLFTRLNTLLSLWTKNSIVTMVLGMFIVLFQTIYYGGAAEDLSTINTYLPQNYIAFGEVITGRFAMQLAEPIPNLYTRGLIVLTSTIIILEFLIYFSSKKITRQKFLN